MKPQVNMKMGRRKKKIVNMKNKKKVNLGAMSVDDFMQSGFDMSDESEDESIVHNNRNGTVADPGRTLSDGNESCSDTPSDEEDEEGEGEENILEELDGSMADTESEANSEIGEGENDNGDNSNFNDSSGDDEDDQEDNGTGSLSEEGGIKKKRINKSKDDEGDWTSANFSHKTAIAKLQKSDPEFYKFLQENDKDLLNFDETDSDDEGEGDEEAGGTIHKPPESLEVDSDESDYEDGERDSRAVTLKMIKEWETQLQNTSSKSCEAILEVMHAFHAVVVRVSSDEDNEPAKYIVTGSGVFNAVIQLCVLELQPALKKFLRIPSGKHVEPSKNKIQWIKVSKSLSRYLTNLIKLLGGVSSAHILAVMLKHLHQMMPFAACFPKLFQPLLKKLVVLWSTNEDTIRVVAFLCLLRFTTHQQKILNKVLKMMYMAFLRNCKFVSPSTLPAINFMRRSLVEIFALDLNVSYQHAFLYIRQLAIHLRNAITLHKKEHIQAVCNWQFIQSIHLWADLLGATASKPQLQPLVYPLVQVTIGTIKLVPTAQYFALRFHCTHILIQLSKRTCTFIPILPFLLEVLSTYDFNKGHKKVSMKPMLFTFIIRSSKSDMLENGFKDVIIDTLYKQMMEYLSNESNSISFPDLIIPAAMQIKEFIKKCKVSNYCRKMKQMLDKIMENAQVVEKERQKVNFKLSDQKSIAAWESQLRLNGTPLSKFYDNWSKMHLLQQAKTFTQSDKIGDFDLPVLKKRSREENKEPDGPVVLFPSDDSDSEADFLKSEEEPIKKRGKRGSGSGQNNKKPKPMQSNEAQKRSVENLDFDSGGDIVEDLKLEDFQ